MGMSTPASAKSPSMAKWVDPLPVPPVATKTYKAGISDWADYYEITMSASQHQFNSGLPGPATVWTYGQPGKSPVLLGPTIVAQSGRPVVVRYINQLPTDPAAFPLKHMQKDLRLALRLAEEVGQPLFATATINELFKVALAEGLGDSDFAAVSRIIKSSVKC